MPKKKKVAEKPKEVKEDKKTLTVEPEGVIKTKTGFVVVTGEEKETFEGGDELSCFNEACKRYKLLMIS